MGDLFFTHNEEGQRYVRRLIYLNILLYIFLGIVFIVNWIDFDILLMLIALVIAVSIIYAINFIYKNPPSEYDPELDALSE